MDSVSHVEDRRVRKTRAALRGAIVELALEKGFQAVTGEDIADRADVTRASFYKHYQNKEDLLADVVDVFASSVLDAFGRPDQARLYPSRIATLIEQTRAQPDVVRLIVSGEGDGVALRRLTEVIELLILDDIEAGRLSVVDSRTDTALMVKMRAAQIVAGVAFALDSDGDDEQLAAAIVAIIDRGWRRARPSLAS